MTESHRTQLITQGYTVIAHAFEKDAARRKIVDVCGSAEYDVLKALYTDEDLALGPSRTNFRLQTRREGELLSPALASLLSSIGTAYSWFDASIITAVPGTGRQPAHRDYSMPRDRSGAWRVVVFTPVEDVLPNGGVTVVYPHTHLGEDSTKQKRIRMQAGDALVFFSSLKHYGAANNSEKFRVVLSQTFEVKGIAFPVAASETLARSA